MNEQKNEVSDNGGGGSEPGNRARKSTAVVIIGGGIAGLAAADLLRKRNVPFVVLEARQRIGGRLWSFRACDYLPDEPVATGGAANRCSDDLRVLEMGANWIHGVLGNPIFELALTHKLVDIDYRPQPKKIVATLPNGQVCPFIVLQEIYQAYVCFVRRCEEYFFGLYSPPPNCQTVGDHLLLEINLYLNKFPNKEDRKLRKMIFDCLLKRETCITGCDNMREIDLIELGSFTELQGGNITIRRGFGALVDLIGTKIPADQLLLNHAVNKIDWSASGAEDGGESGKKSIVYCDNGTVFEAEHVIVTVPLGVLKKTCRTLFEPQLPDYKLDAIDRLLFGTVDKIFLIYDRPFLNPEISEILLIWDDFGENLHESDTRSSSSSGDDDESDLDLAENWFKKIYSFSKLSDTILLGWISGRAAQFMETLSQNEIAAKCTEILRQFLNDQCIPKPVKCICSNWASEKYTRGSYTAMATGCSQLEIEMLAAPLYADHKTNKPTVLFAGEHTHINYYSTVHGAYLTGRSAAQLILDSRIEQENTERKSVNAGRLERIIELDGSDSDLSALIERVKL